MSSLATHLVWLNKTSRSNRHLVGSKAANLGELMRLGLAVPPGVCVTTDAYDYFLKKSGIFFELNHILTSQTGDPLGASAQATELMGDAEIPDLLKNQIAQAYAALRSESCDQYSMAVRSSSLDEDLVYDSFAGLYDSYLHISDLDTLLQRIKACWTSFWSERALVYRMARGFLNRPITGAVILQKMVDAEAAGVLFTRNPVENGNVSMALEVARGTGEQIVSGAITPDRYVITKPGLQIASKQLAVRNEYRDLVSVSEQSQGWEVPPEVQEILSESEILELCRFGLSIEDAFQQPQDIEWARAHGQYYFLQTRPVTSTQDEPDEVPDPSIWTRNNINERFPEPLKPLEASFVNEWVFTPGCARLFRNLGFDAAKGSEVFRVFRGLLYVNKQLFAAALRGVPESITRRIFEPNRDGEAPRVLLSWPLLLTLARILKMALRGHRQFARKLPKFLARHQRFRACDYEELHLNQLARELTALGQLIRHISSGHMQSIIVAEVLFSLLTQVCPNNDVLLLVRGMDANKTVEMDRRFSDLCRVASCDETVYSTLMSASAEQAMEKLKGRSYARQFLWLLNWFLEDFGHRSAKYQLSHPRWREEPQQLLGLIRTSIAARTHSESGSPDHKRAAELQKAAEQNLIKSRFDRIFPWKKAAFRLLLHYARIYCGILRENEGFYITMPFPEVKRILACIANELVSESVLEHRDDIYFLTIPEVIQAAGGGPCSDLGNTVAIRKQAFFHSTLERAEAPIALDAVLSGTAASPGIASGRARILSSPGEGFEPGGILVTHSLNAAWVPLMRSAGGVVTDVGGMLSHAAVLAREFRVPAVLGAGAATASIQQNQTITVDGTNGKVFLSTQ